MFLRKAFGFLPCLMWAMTNVEPNGPSEAIGFLDLNKSSSPEAVEDTQPQTVELVVFNFGGSLVGNFEVSSIKELREKLAVERRWPPEYVKLLNGDVTLKDDTPFAEFKGIQQVAVNWDSPQSPIAQKVFDATLPLFQNGLKGEFRLPEKSEGEYWKTVRNELDPLFQQSDEHTSCNKIEGAVDATTPDCLHFRLGIFKEIWNAGRELGMVEGFPVQVNPDSEHRRMGAFEDILPDDKWENKQQNFARLKKSQIMIAKKKGSPGSVRSMFVMQEVGEHLRTLMQMEIGEKRWALMEHAKAQ